MIKLKIIIASTRPGRKGPLMADWIFKKAQSHTAFDVELIDLAVVNLPFLDEPNHPRQKKYTQQHTKDWSEKIDASDAFILVTPEYNYGFPATIKNAIDFLFHEWRQKPIGFVSYGGLAGGTRAEQMLKLTLSALEMVILSSSVNIPFFNQYIKDEVFVPSENIDHMASSLLRDLAIWSEPLSKIRAESNP